MCSGSHDVGGMTMSVEHTNIPNDVGFILYVGHFQTRIRLLPGTRFYGYCNVGSLGTRTCILNDGAEILRDDVVAVIVVSSFEPTLALNALYSGTNQNTSNLGGIINLQRMKMCIGSHYYDCAPR
jgi:hypothetical protein